MKPLRMSPGLRNALEQADHGRQNILVVQEYKERNELWWVADNEFNRKRYEGRVIAE